MRVVAPTVSAGAGRQAADGDVRDRPRLGVLRHPVDAGDDHGGAAPAGAVEDADAVDGRLLGDSPRGAGGGAGDVGAVTVAVGPGLGVDTAEAQETAGHEVASHTDAARELGVVRVQTGVDDVDVRVLTGVVGVAEGRVQRQGLLVGAVQAPGRVRLLGGGEDRLVATHGLHEREGPQRRHRHGREAHREPVEHLVVGEQDAAAQRCRQLPREARHDVDSGVDGDDVVTQLGQPGDAAEQRGRGLGSGGCGGGRLRGGGDASGGESERGDQAGGQAAAAAYGGTTGRRHQAPSPGMWS